MRRRVSRTKKAKAADADAEEDSECVVCLDAQSAVEFRTCGHVVACAECAAKLDTCPICRAPILYRAPVCGRITL